MHRKPPESFVEVRRAGSASPALPIQARLPSFVGGPADAVERLGASRIAILTTGSVGGRIAEYVARYGIHTLWLVDYKKFKLESVLTHTIGPEVIGMSKARVMARRCKRISPQTRVFFFDGPVQQLPFDALADADLVVLASDNLACEVEVGQRCIHLRRPLVQAAVDGPTLTAVIRFFGNADGVGPCPRCLFGQAEREALDAESEYSCEPKSAAIAPPGSRSKVTMSVAPLCAMAASMAGQQILRYLLQLGRPVADTFLEYNGYTHATVVTEIKRNQGCPCEHVPWLLARAPRALGACTIGELLARSGVEARPEQASIRVDGHSWVESARCRCAQPRAVRHFIRRDQPSIGTCHQCGGALVADPFFTYETLPAALLGPGAARPLSQLGAARARAILVNAGSQAILFRNPAGKRQPFRA